MHGNLSECCKHWGTLMNICITLFNYMVVCILPWGSKILPSWEKNLKNKKKLTPVRIMNSIGLYSTNSVNNVGIFNDSANININFTE